MIRFLNLILVFVGLVLPLTSRGEIQMAITVDDLPSHGKLPMGVSRLEVAKKMLSVLKKHGVPEVYGFTNASKVEFQKEDEAVLLAWRQAGYPLANHTYTHVDINKVEASVFEADITRNEKLLAQLNEGLDWKYFRYPFLHEGDTLEKRNAVREFLKKNDYRIAQVTVDFEDWGWNNPYARCADKKDKKAIKWLKKTYLEQAGLKLDQTEKITTYLFKRPVKHILLLHVGAFDVEMLNELLQLYKKKGVKFIALSEAVKDEIYAVDPAVTGRSGSELHFQILKSRGLKLKDTGALSVKYPEEELDNLCP